MVKYIIELNSECVTKEVIIFEKSFLIISETCFFPEEFRLEYKYADNFNKSFSEGKFFYRTSSSLEKGLIISKLLALYPQARLVTSNTKTNYTLYPNLKLTPLKSSDQSLENIVYSQVPSWGSEQLQPILKSSNPNPDIQVNQKIPSSQPIVIESKINIPPRSYEEKPNFNPLNLPEPRIQGPLIGKPTNLLTPSLNQKSEDLPKSQFELKHKLDPISRYEAKIKELEMEFEGQDDVCLVSTIVMAKDELTSVNRFSQLFHLVLESSADILEMGVQENVEKLKALVISLFEKKIFTIKNDYCSLNDLFLKNCWDVEVEFRQN